MASSRAPNGERLTRLDRAISQVIRGVILTSSLKMSRKRIVRVTIFPAGPFSFCYPGGPQASISRPDLLRELCEIVEGREALIAITVTWLLT